MDTPPGDLEQAIAEVIQSRMQEQGISEKRLADETFIPRITLRRRFAVPRNLTVSELATIAKQLGTTPDEITAAARRRAAA